MFGEGGTLSGDVEGKRVILVEDVVTTGGTTHALAREVVSKGGAVVGVLVLVDRGGCAALSDRLGAPVVPLLTLDSLTACSSL